MDSLFIAGTFQQQVRHLQKQQKHNPNDDCGLCGCYMKGIAFVPIGAAPGAGGGKEGIGQGNEMNDGRPNNGCFGNNKGEGNHSGNKIQDQTMGDQPAPEGFSQGQLPEPKLPQRYGRIHWTLTSSIFVFSSLIADEK